MAEGSVGQNMVGTSDSNIGLSPMGDEVAFEDMPKEFVKLFTQAEKIIDRMAKKASTMVDDVKKATGDVGKDQPGSGRLGLGSFSRTEKLAGLGMGAMAVGSAYMSMAPNTMAAVTQRIGADSYAGISGMSSRQAILQANRQVGGGATSAMGPTMAAANLYASGYTANSLSSRNIMGQLGGLSAMSGMSNEQAAGAVAGINGMNYLRMGVRVRNSKGDLNSPNSIVNQVYNSMFRGQKITSEQAAASLMNPGGKGYQTLLQITGGDQAQMQMLQSGLMARATKGSAITAKDMKDPNKMLDAMGVDKSSPLRANFRYNSSEAKKLAATEEGLVGGYDASLRTAASLNDAYSKMADILGPVNDGLMTLKGILQTFPNAGGMGGTVSGIASTATSVAGSALQYKMMGNFLKGGPSAAGNAVTAARAAAPALTMGSVAAGAGIAAAAGGVGYLTGKGGKALGKKLGVSDGVTRAGSTLAAAGTGALTGAAIGSVVPVVGTAAGAVVGTIAGGIMGYFGSGGESSNTVNLPQGNGSTGGKSAYAMPVPKGTTVSSKFGHRKGGMVNGKKISSNHQGIDFRTPENTPVTALADGTVLETGRKGDWGNYVLLKHVDGTSSRYAHLNAILVSRGQKVKAGTVIGKSGGAKGNPGAGNSTGAHLHFEYLNASGVRVDPAPFLSGVKSADPKYSWTGYSHTNFVSSKKTSEQVVLANLGSPALSSLLSSAISSGEPISWDDIASKTSGGKNLGTTGAVNTVLDKASGDTKGMAGGSRAGLMKMLHAQGFRGKGLQTAFAVALAESGGRADAIGDVSLQTDKWGPSVGAFQIRSLKDWKAYNDPYRDATRLKNATYNAKAAFVKSNQGKSFKGWSTFTSGSFAKFLDDAQTASKQANIGGPVANEVNLPHGGSSSHGNYGGSNSTTFNARSNVNITLKMDVHIARSSIAEADNLVKLVGQKLRNDAELKRIAGSL